MRRVVSLVLVSLLMATVVTGCAGGGGNKPLKIGVAEPLTGPVALNGEMRVKGLKLAIKQVNAQGGISWRFIELKIMDDRSDPKEAANIANMFVQDPDVIAVICHANSSCYLAAIPIYNKGKLMSCSTNSSSPLIKGAGPYVSRLTLNDNYQGLKVADFMWEDGIKKAGVFFENTDYGRGVLGAVDTQFKKLGGQIVAVEAGALGGTQDYSAIVTKYRNSGAEAIAAGCNYTEAALLVKQMRNAGLNIPVYGTQGLFVQPFIQIGGSAVEGTFTHGGLSLEESSPKLAQFAKDYEAEYGAKNEVGWYSTVGYDAGMLFAEVMKKGGTTREKFAEIYKGIQSYEGAQTTYTMVGDGDVTYPLKRFVVKDGTFKLLKK